MQRWWVVLASEIAARQPDLPLDALETAARQSLQQCLFARLCEDRNLSAWDGEPVGEAFAPLRSALKPGLPIEILGEVHQQLLGNRLERSDRGLRAVRSAASRKAAGIFYTPGVVRDYILGRTLGQRLEESGSVHAVTELRLLDPACGCGAFLISASRRLLAWATDHRVPLPAATVAAMLHGVDLDPEAVAIARRSLWLELASAAESPEEAEQVATMLRANVQCGDALLDEPFGDFLRFDFVVGNPPYRRERNAKELFGRLAGSPLGRHRSPRMDYWHYFAHRGLEWLKPGGRLSFIVNSYWTASHGAERLISELRKTAEIDELFLLGNARIFDGVAGRHMILTLTKGSAHRTILVKRPPPGTRLDAEAAMCRGTSLQVFRKTPGQLFRGGRLDLEPPADELLAKFAAGKPLGELGRVRQGIAENPAAVTAAAVERFGGPWAAGEGVFALTPAELLQLDLSEVEQQLIRPYFDLCDLGRYRLAEEPSLRLIYATCQTWPELQQFPGLAAHLARFRPIMEARRETRLRTRSWWHLHWPRDASLWESDKIVALQMACRPAFVPVSGPVYVSFSANVFVPDRCGLHRNYFAGLLNSRLMEYWYCRHAKRRGIGLEINGRVLARTPIRTIDFRNPAESALHDELVTLVAEVMCLNRQLHQLGAAAENLRGQVEEAERRIDQIVYHLYGLDDAEIATVEASKLPPPAPRDARSREAPPRLTGIRKRARPTQG